MSITYVVDEFDSSDRQVKVTYTNDEGLIYEKYVNIPHNEDGSVNEEYFQEILEGQLRGVQHKNSLSVITFIEPTESVGIGTTIGD
jgi:hypothetical protein